MMSAVAKRFTKRMFLEKFLMSTLVKYKLQEQTFAVI